QEGLIMYDSTIVPLYAKLAVNGEAYLTCKLSYTIGSFPSNLCIVDYLHSMMGSACDALAVEYTAVAKYPD
ncbi:hypothetical protein PAXRUDRAFT_150690, partial [Paxillus rubicundulus Ve08.2h10]